MRDLEFESQLNLNRAKLIYIKQCKDPTQVRKATIKVKIGDEDGVPWRAMCMIMLCYEGKKATNIF